MERPSAPAGLLIETRTDRMSDRGGEMLVGRPLPRGFMHPVRKHPRGIDPSALTDTSVEEDHLAR